MIVSAIDFSKSVDCQVTHEDVHDCGPIFGL